MATAFNSEAEQHALITILNSKSVDGFSGKLLGALGAEDFGTEPGNEVISKVLSRLRSGKEVPKRNILMLDSSLSAEAKEFLENIRFKPVKDESSAETLIETLKFHRKIRKILDAARQMAEECKKAEPDDINAIEAKLDQLTMDIKGNEKTSKIVTFGMGDRSQADEVISRITQKDDSKRIKTGFPYFDGRAGGAKKGHAFLVAGPAGGGKSALANQLLINMYVNPPHNKTLFVSFEMDEDECVARMAANVCGIEFSNVERKCLSLMETQKLSQEIRKFHQIGIDNKSWFKVWPPDDSLTASNIISYCRPLKPDVLVVDYIGLLGQDNPKEEQWRALGSAMRQFKMAAKKLDCLIIVLAQFDQDAMVVKYARALREHANIMWCWTYGKEEEETGIVTIRQTAPFGKNRNCPPFDFRVKYELKYMKITDYGEAAPNDISLVSKKGPGTKQPGTDPSKAKKIKSTYERANSRFEDDEG